METVDGCGIHIYGALRITTNATDRHAKSQQRQDKYVVADIRNYNMILGDP